MQNDEAEDAKMGERDDPNESHNTEGEGNDIRAGVWTLAPISVKPKGKEKEEKTVHCQLCSESFFYESGLRTHMDHVHVDYKANEDEILAEKISRQQNVLSSIPKAEKKKRKHTKKEEGKVKRSKNADEKQPLTHQKCREMQEDEFKSKKSDIADTYKKKKYELRKRKQDEDVSDNSMSVTDAMSILDKHKSRKTVEEDVTKKGNDEPKVNIDRKPKRITRLSTGQQTITETLDEIFKPDHSDGTANNENAEKTTVGKQKLDTLATDSDSQKGKKTKQKSNKSIVVPDDDTEQTEAGNNRRQTHSTTLKTKNSDNDSKPDGDRTITDENPKEGKNEMADDEQNDEQPKLDTSIGKRSKCKRTALSTENGQDTRNETTNEVQQDEETDDLFHCHICKKTFVNYNNFRAHKIKCWPTARKHQY